MYIEDIPDGVVNVKEYRKFLLLQRHPILTDTTYIDSNGEEINIAMLIDKLRKRIAHLSPQEQDDILERKSEYNKMRAKVSTAKAVAFGHAGRYGGNRKKETSAAPFHQDIMELLGRMFTVKEVVKIMGEDNGIIITEEDVKEVQRRFLPEIERKREEFRNKLTDVRLYHKRPRLEELAWMYSKMKNRYIILNSTDAYNAMLRTLEQIRKESEGDILTVKGAMDVNIEVTIQQHIQQEIFKTINIKEIILGRVAARMNYNPMKLIAGLHNSYYAKFVDIGGDYDPNAEMEYPSNKAYDFAAIERTAGREVVKMEEEPITSEESSSASAVKQMFLEKIRKQKADMEKRATLADYAAEDNRPVAEDEDVVNKSRPGGSKDKNLKSSKNSGSKRDYYTGKKK